MVEMIAGGIIALPATFELITVHMYQSHLEVALFIYFARFSSSQSCNYATQRYGRTFGERS